MEFLITWGLFVLGILVISVGVLGYIKFLEWADDNLPDPWSGIINVITIAMVLGLIFTVAYFES